MFLQNCNITEGRPIRVFTHGDMERDSTFISDIVEGIRRFYAWFQTYGQDNKAVG